MPPSREQKFGIDDGLSRREQMEQFANQQGDPYGNSTVDQMLSWANDYFGQHPELSREDEFVSAHNGNVKDNRSWLDRNSGKIAGIGAVALPAAVFAAPALAGMGGGGGGSAATGAASASSGVPSLSVTSGLTSLPGTAIAAPVAPGGSMGILGNIFNYGKKIFGVGGGNTGNVLDATARGLGSLGQSSANNRGTVLDAMMEADKLRMEAAQQRRAEESDIMKKMQIAEYLKNGGAGDFEPSTSAMGRQFTKFSFGPKATTDAEKKMAAILEEQLRDRLAHPMELSDYSKMYKPSGFERTMNYLAPIFSVWGAGRGAGRYQVPQTTTPRPTPEPAIDYNTE